MKPLDKLKELLIAEQRVKYPNVPYHCANIFDTAKPEKKEKKRIEKFCELMGHSVSIIENRGQRKDNTKIVEDVLGHKKVIGSVEWIGSGMKKGIADLVGGINGRSISIEVKRVYKKGKDRQSDAQKKYQQMVEKDGGIYIIVSGFDEFFNWYCENIKQI
jgi:hypothetical protein